MVRIFFYLFYTRNIYISDNIKINFCIVFCIGSSMLSEPITFTLGDHHITSAYSSNTTGMICGIIFGILSIGLGIIAIIFYKRRKSIKSANGVAFENPSYLREVNMEHVQVCKFI